MKKTLILASLLTAFSSLVSAATTITFYNKGNGPENPTWINTGSGDGGLGLTISGSKVDWTLPNNIKFSAQASAGDLYYSGSDAASLFTPADNHSTAVNEWLAMSGVDYTQLKQGFGPGNGGADLVNTTITDSSFQSGNSLTMYIVAGLGGSRGNLTLDVTGGLTDVTLSVATFVSGSGWDTVDATTATRNDLTMNRFTIFKVEGTLTGESVVFDLEGSNGKSVLGGISYEVTPEPTTATLSLLALAGLCARRRRK